MLKHCLLALMLAGLIYAASPSAIAQNSQSTDQQSAPAGGPPEHGHRQFDPQTMTDRLTKDLNLTADQQTKVLDILKSQQSQMESLRSDTSLSQEDRHAKMMDIRKSSDSQIRGILDSNQQKKWDEMQANREHRHGQHQSGNSPNSDQQ
jgi:periplasmic protein CpxP/Spy